MHLLPGLDREATVREAHSLAGGTRLADKWKPPRPKALSLTAILLSASNGNSHTQTDSHRQ